MVNQEREHLIGLVKEVVFPAFPGGGLDVSVANQLPEHAFEAIAEHLIANGVTIPVRCKKCKMRCPESVAVSKHCTLTGVPVCDVDFCSFGERGKDESVL